MTQLIQTNRSKSGFSLVATLVVIGILGILVSLATYFTGPDITDSLNKAKKITVHNNARSIAQSINKAVFLEGNKVGDGATTVKEFAEDLAVKGGLVKSEIWFGVNPPDGLESTVSQVSNWSDTDFAVAADIDSTVKNPRFVPVVWTRGLEWDSFAEEWTSDLGDIAIVGFANGNVMDLSNKDTKSVFKDPTEPTKSLDNVKAAVKKINGASVIEP